MAYKKLKIICDADDVLISCNAYALQLLSQTKGQYFDISGITAWGSMGNELDERMQFFEYEEFYENQPALPGARKFLISLMEKANVFIATAVYPEFMGERIRRIQTLFPEFPLDHIVMGKRKGLSVYNAYPGQCEIIYTDRDKRDCIMSIIQKPALRREQVADRIVSFEFEEKNKVLADHIVSVGNGSLEKEVNDVISYLKL